ncbi:hypothetical protein B0H16DRAFT_1446271 [Mycena metata]|uniref:RRM domain-containing protein n=1 Tax=Mycena metata TaxID=1033252 RepID=A0AAD7KJU3_9AGAR|nr:hypothetical protein B0H16DRAFT_1446271 [Mycena metata]
MSAPQKLTKKQKKGLAFRDRKGNKSRGNDASSTGLEDNEVPVLEVQDLADGEIDSPAVEVAKKHDASGDSKAKGKEGQQRQGKGEGEGGSRSPDTKEEEKRAGSGGWRSGGSRAGQGRRGRRAEAEKDQGGFWSGWGCSKRQGGSEAAVYFIRRQSQIYDHGRGHKDAFCSMLTRRQQFACGHRNRLPGKPANKSKGCAFVEFSHRNALQQGLKLHQSELEGRRINVELTVGGGGKSGASY